MDKNKWQIEISQNGWEYTGYAWIECVEVVADNSNDHTIIADGIKISFDEQIGEITKV